MEIKVDDVNNKYLPLRTTRKVCMSVWGGYGKKGRVAFRKRKLLRFQELVGKTTRMTRITRRSTSTRRRARRKTTTTTINVM